jgi:hypothetical protein
MELESLKFGNTEDEWNITRKVVCELAGGILGRKVRNTDRNISENAFRLVENRRGL